ncbi:ComEA family DNA-binding protein [Paenibacillus sp. BAC0078]
MNKRILALVIAAGLLGGGLVWAADREEDSGIAGWKTLNASMAQALGSADKGATSAAAGGSSVEESSKPGEERGEKGAGTGKEGSAGKEDAASTVAAANAARSVGAEAVTPPGNGAGTPVSGSNVGAEAGAGNSAGAAAGAGSGETSTSQTFVDGKINVNTADAAALMNLPGIGAKKAQAIIDYRSSKGAFRSLSDLGEVKGIGPKLLEKLKPLVIF